jgi:hypothetical protein
MDGVATTDGWYKKLYQANLHKKWYKQRPKARWKDDAENDIRKMGIVNWRQAAQDRDGWRAENRETFILLG